MVTKSISKLYVVLCDYICDGNIINTGRYVSSYSTLERAVSACENLNLVFSSSSSAVIPECRYYVQVDYIL